MLTPKDIFLINFSDIEKPRSSSELKEFVQRVKDSVCLDSIETQKATKGVGMYKAFVDEIIPLSQFAELLYSPDLKFLPVIGNQGFDVLVKDASGEILDKIEITNPHDGDFEAEDKRLAKSTGSGNVRVCDLGGQLKFLEKFIFQTAKKKALKDYRDCTLVFVASTLPPFDFELEILEEHCKKLTEQFAKYPFKAKRVVLFSTSLKKCFVIES